MMQTRSIACKNCRHFLNDHYDPFTLRYGKCTIVKSNPWVDITPNLVDGSTNNIQPKNEYQYASSMRKYGDCGIDGKLFEAERDMVKQFYNKYGCSTITMAKIYVVIFIVMFVLGIIMGMFA
jgi:hypothetical protein